jgi:hypothetical protein
VADWQRFFSDPAVDTLLEIVIGLGSEVFILKSQLALVQRLLETKGVLTREEWEQHQADAEMKAWFAQERDRFAARLLEPLTAGERSYVSPAVVHPWNPTYPASTARASTTPSA